MTYKIKELQPAVAAAALGLVTLYENKTARDVSEPTLGAIRNRKLKDGNMFSIEFKFSAPATTPKLSKIYKGVEFTGDKSRQYTDSIEAGLCIYEKRIQNHKLQLCITIALDIKLN